MSVSSDRDTLHLLSIFHFVLAGLIALMACIPMIHFAGGIFMVFGGAADNEPAVSVMGGFFAIFAGAIILVGWALAYFIFRAGKSLDRQENYQQCQVAAAILCLFMPFGTILGVFTLVTLSGEEVKKLFNGATTVTETE